MDCHSSRCLSCFSFLLANRTQLCLRLYSKCLEPHSHWCHAIFMKHRHHGFAGVCNTLWLSAAPEKNTPNESFFYHLAFQFTNPLAETVPCRPVDLTGLYFLPNPRTFRTQCCTGWLFGLHRTTSWISRKLKCSDKFSRCLLNVRSLTHKIRELRLMAAKNSWYYPDSGNLDNQPQLPFCSVGVLRFITNQ